MPVRSGCVTVRGLSSEHFSKKNVQSRSPGSPGFISFFRVLHNIGVCPDQRLMYISRTKMLNMFYLDIYFQMREKDQLNPAKTAVRTRGSLALKNYSGRENMTITSPQSSKECIKYQPEDSFSALQIRSAGFIPDSRSPLPVRVR